MARSLLALALVAVAVQASGLASDTSGPASGAADPAPTEVSEPFGEVLERKVGDAKKDLSASLEKMNLQGLTDSQVHVAHATNKTNRVMAATNEVFFLTGAGTPKHPLTDEDCMKVVRNFDKVAEELIEARATLEKTKKIVGAVKAKLGAKEFGKDDEVTVTVDGQDVTMNYTQFEFQEAYEGRMFLEVDRLSKNIDKLKTNFNSRMRHNMTQENAKRMDIIASEMTKAGKALREVVESIWKYVKMLRHPRALLQQIREHGKKDEEAEPSALENAAPAEGKDAENEENAGEDTKNQGEEADVQGEDATKAD